MEKLLKTKSGNEVFSDANGTLLVKGNVSVLLQELNKDREDLSLPHDVHNTCVILHTLITLGKYKKIA